MNRMMVQRIAKIAILHGVCILMASMLRGSSACVTKSHKLIRRSASQQLCNVNRNEDNPQMNVDWEEKLFPLSQRKEREYVVGDTCAQDTNACPYISKVPNSGNHISKRSIAPWYYVKDCDSSRYPSVLYRACCACVNCVNLTTLTRMDGLFTTKLEVRIKVDINNTVTQWQYIAVGCACATAKTP